MMKNKKYKIEWTTLVFIAIMLLAVCTRFLFLDQYPNGTYTDEAYGAYNAWGLLTSGIDDRGYSYPVYFVAWGSGMNSLYTYLGMLMFKIFGVSLFAYRVPQALFGVLSIWALYELCKELFHKYVALLAAFALTVTPWHIMMCRFGLDANQAPSMFLIGLMFLVWGIRKKEIYLVPAAIFFGLTLYCYALTWLMLPLFLLLCIIAGWKWIPKSKMSVAFCVIMGLLALPLFLFLAINFDIIPEIRTEFFSIPKLTGFRGGELSMENIKNGIDSFIGIVIKNQAEMSSPFNVPATGIYYYFTTPFMLFGVLYHLHKLFRSYQTKQEDVSIVFLLWLVSAAIISIINERLTIIHINMVHIPVIFYAAYGIYGIAELLKSKAIPLVCVAFYVFSLFSFGDCYVNTDVGYFFGDEPYEAVERAKEIAGEEKNIILFGGGTYKFPNLLWREKPDMKHYSENVVYDDDPFFIELVSYERYKCISSYTDTSEITQDGVYVLLSGQMGVFARMGFEVEQVNDYYAVAAMSIPAK